MTPPLIWPSKTADPLRGSLQTSGGVKLGVNIDHVATLRQARLARGEAARGDVYPDPALAARVCERAGAGSVVMHLREDRRHIQDADLFLVKKSIKGKLNLEMSIAPSVVKVARGLAPDQVTFVPERRMERTTEGGLDLYHKTNSLARCVELFKKTGVLVSLFIEPDERAVKEAKRLSADAVEFHTGRYANARTLSEIKKELHRIQRGVLLADSLGLVSHAGHGLDYENVRGIRKITGIEELNIGYAIITRALWVGLGRAVREMISLVK